MPAPGSKGSVLVLQPIGPFVPILDNGSFFIRCLSNFAVRITSFFEGADNWPCCCVQSLQCWLVLLLELLSAECGYLQRPLFRDRVGASMVVRASLATVS